MPVSSLLQSASPGTGRLRLRPMAPGPAPDTARAPATPAGSHTGDALPSALPAADRSRAPGVVLAPAAAPETRASRGWHSHCRAGLRATESTAARRSALLRLAP